MREDGISATTEVAHNLPNDEKLVRLYFFLFTISL